MIPAAAAKPGPRVRLGTALGLARSLAVYYGQVWKPPRLRRFYARFVGPGDPVFDIGAHVGNRSRALAKLGARVVAVEPQAACHALLRRLLPAGRTTLIRAAVGERPGWTDVRVSSLHPTVSSTAGDWVQRMGGQPGFRAVAWDRTERVPVTTLDALIAAHGVPAFCKIDVEGMEARILAGLSQPIPRLSVEVLPEAPDEADAVLARLDALGDYRFNLVEGERGRFAWPGWCRSADARAKLRGLGRPADLYAFRADLVPADGG
jgi:FkbM family methyltransferase